VRFFSVFLIWLALLAAPFAAQAGNPASGPFSGNAQRTERIEAELVSMSDWAAPGSTAVVAIRQKIAPGWHTYWRNPGDSGGPTTLTWALAGDVHAGDIVWPLPSRQPLQGLMNYGYSDVVFLPVPIEIPGDARIGVAIPLRVKALFLVCSDQMCVPDELTLTFDLPVAEGAAPLSAPYGKAIQSVIETAPRPAGITARATLVDGGLRLTASGGPLAGLDLKRASFFPYESNVIDHAAAQTGQRGANGLTLDLTPGGDLKATGQINTPILGVLATDAGAWEISAEPGQPLAGASGQGALSPTLDAVKHEAVTLKSVLQAGLFALLGGLILNLMPCVFPVLAMKAAALTRTAHDPAEARRDGLAFLAGVLVTFVTLAAVLLALRAGGQAIGWGFQLQSPAVVAGLALLMLAVALNLSAVFEIGARLQGVSASPLARLPGGAGAFFTGVLAVVVAAPCTAPFMAFALGAALLMPAPLALLVFLLLGLGLALPYVLVSFSPGLLRRLPRPGPWMEIMRRLLSVPMFLAALWLVWVFARQTDQAALLWLVAAAVVIAAALAVAGWRQRSSGAGFGLTGAAIAVGLIAGFGLTAMAVRVAAQASASGADGVEIAADAWSERRVEAALAAGHPVLVNFTADWCVTCKINERTSLSSPAVAKALEEANAVYLRGDWTRRDDAITRELQRHGRSGAPLYLLYTPGKTEPRILPQLLTEGVVVDALAGTKRD